MGLKLLGLGLKNYILDKVNIFDTLVNVLSLLDLLLFQSNNFKLTKRRPRTKRS